MATRKLTLLHSNDLHGDFFPRTAEDIKAGKTGYPEDMPKGFVLPAEKLPEDFEIGGLSRLSGYVRKVRSESENVVYMIAGDNFRGSIIDEEYMGLSTIEMVNLLDPDVTTIGNHEVDYGVAHGALAMTTPGDTSTASLKEVEKIVSGAGARVDR